MIDFINDCCFNLLIYILFYYYIIIGLLVFLLMNIGGLSRLGFFLIVLFLRFLCNFYYEDVSLFFLVKYLRVIFGVRGELYI